MYVISIWYHEIFDLERKNVNIEQIKICFGVPQGIRTSTFSVIVIVILIITLYIPNSRHLMHFDKFPKEKRNIAIIQ